MVSGASTCSNNRAISLEWLLPPIMLKTRLYVECPSCHMQYLRKDFGLTYSNGAYIENVAGCPDWQRLICPCQPENPYRFKLNERTRLHVFRADESEQTHFSLGTLKLRPSSIKS
jgi:hypothetical protein